jgi:hypothetical protein
VDNPQLGPRLSSYAGTYAASATANSHVQAYADIPMENTTPWAHTGPTFRAVDFKASAKAFRRSHLKRRLLRYSIIIISVILLIIAALGSVGYALNTKYAGRALPYSYIGNISIGGLTQAEIKALLDVKASEITVTLVEGGLIKEVPISAFDPNFDTQKASEQAITGFNPFSYLSKHTFEVPVTVNELYVDGYLRLNVAVTQVKAENASIVKDKKGLVISPETVGNRTSTAYVVEQLQKQLVTLNNPVIKLTAATDKPTITAADLTDEIDKAKQLISSKAGLRIGGSVIRPTEDQKLSWLEISEVPGNSAVQIKYSQTKVREYVLEMAKKYSTVAVDDILETSADGSQKIIPGVKGLKVINADEVALGFYQTLGFGSNDVIAFKVEESDYKKIDPASIVAIAPAAQSPTSDSEQVTQ